VSIIYRFSLAAALLFALPYPAAPHDIPNDVTVHAFLKPAGGRMQLLVRAPLVSMRDVDFPKHGPGYLDLGRLGTFLHDAATVWISQDVELYENDTRLERPRIVAARVSLPSDRSFESFDAAVAHISAPPLPESTELIWNQALIDVLLECPIQSDQSQFSIRSGMAQLGVRTVTVLRFLPPGGAVRAFEFESDPGLVRLDPRWSQAALRFLKLGFLHILDGTDHLLFLLCLVIPFRRFRALIPVVTSFTVAHSITLIASAYDLGPDALWFPPLIEALIAISIVYMALENIVGGASVKRRWMMTFAFGLVHGFGFSFALRQTLQFAGSHMLTSLVSFNVGVELGQLLVLAVLVPALEILFRFVVAERTGTIILSALVAHTGWHWTEERVGRLRQFRFEGPAINAAFLASAMRWMMVVVFLAGLVWLGSVALRYREQRRSGDETAP
jgi:hypothetical protein